MPTAPVASVAAIVCTFNRPQMLRACIEGLQAQVCQLTEIVVVDNAPHEPSIRALRSRFAAVTFLLMSENLGPAGGFVEGMKYAFERGYRYVWLFNDDAVPESTALLECMNLTDRISRSGGVIAHDAIKTNNSEPEYVDIFNFNGALVSREVITLVGYPRAEYFMCYWENDYSLRIRKAGLPIVNVPGGHVHHAYAGTKIDGRTPPWRGYYQTRNELATARSQRSPLLMMRWAIRQVKFVAAVLTRGDQRMARVKYRSLGAWHAVRGIEGRTIEPTHTGGS